MPDTCEELNQIFAEEAGRIGPEIYRNTHTNNAWNGLVEQGEWPDGMGSILSTLVYGRATMGAPVVFTPIASSDTPTPADSYPTANLGFQKVKVPKTRLQYQLQGAEFESEDIALEDLRFAYEVEEQVSTEVTQLSDFIQNVFTDHRRSEYTRLSGHKVIARDNLPEGSASFPLQIPTSTINQSILDEIYPKLIRAGAGRFAYAMDGGRPIFTLIGGAKQLDLLARQNAQDRKDIRLSKDAEKLLAPMGVSHTYKGFFYLADDYADRWDFVAGAWVKREVYDPDTGEESALYTAAAYEDLQIFLPSVYKELVPKVRNGVGQAVYTEPNSYRGEWHWLNIKDRHCNPWGNVGFFAAKVVTASKPGLVKHGYTIRVKRCPNDIDQTSCRYGQ